jgi:hypothetical protein
MHMDYELHLPESLNDALALLAFAGYPKPMVISASAVPRPSPI